MVTSVTSGTTLKSSDGERREQESDLIPSDNQDTHEGVQIKVNFNMANE